MEMDPKRAARLFAAKPRTDKPLMLAYSPDEGCLRVHARRCSDLTPGEQADGSFDVGNALETLTEDFFEVAPCARERNWSPAEIDASDAH